MLVNSAKMKHLRQNKNWTQQHLADVCGLSMRTIQRVEKDGVASNETVGAYASIFEIPAAQLLVSVEEFEGANRNPSQKSLSPILGGMIFVGGLVLGLGTGVALALWLL